MNSPHLREWGPPHGGRGLSHFWKILAKSIGSQILAQRDLGPQTLFYGGTSIIRLMVVLRDLRKANRYSQIFKYAFA